MENTKEKEKSKKGKFYRNFVELILVGSVTGIFAGAIVTLFNVLVHEGEKISADVYAYVRSNPAFIPLLLFALVAGAFLLGVAVNISSVVRGCGIPQAEGATRGVIRFTWWRELTLMFSASLLSIFMGLSIGAEGPSVLIGACAGDGVAALSKRNPMIRKYQATGGACTGLAVASNAPLTGMAFAFEEAYKRLTPEVFICSVSSVVFGMLTRSCIYNLLHMTVTNSFSTYVFYDLPLSDYGFVALAGLACGLLGVGFYKLAFFMRRAFKKVGCKNEKVSHSLRVLIAVLAGGLVSFLAASVMGGGHDLIEKLGSGSAESVETLFGLSLAATLAVVLVLKFVITTVNVGSGVPCGIFIPMIAIGACLGALLNRLFFAWGMEQRYGDLMIMICMAAFFTTVVKAPITSIVMICEFTGSFAYLLPVIIAVAIGYIVGELFRTDGIYEELLEQYEEETGVEQRAARIVFHLEVAHGAIAEKREIRDVLWPKGARVKEIVRGEETLYPDGDTVLRSGDKLLIVCTTDEPKKIQAELEQILG